MNFIFFKKINPAQSSNGFSTYQLQLNKDNYAEVEFNTYAARLGFITYTSDKNLSILIEKLKKVCRESGRNKITFADKIDEQKLRDLIKKGFIEELTYDIFNHYLCLELKEKLDQQG